MYTFTLWIRLHGAQVSGPYAHMGHCTDQFSILENRGARHSLDNAAGDAQQPFIIDLQQQVSCCIPQLRVNAQNLHRKLLNLVPFYIAADYGSAGMRLTLFCHRNRLAVKQAGGRPSKYAAGPVGKEGSDVPRQVKGPVKLSRLLSLIHISHSISLTRNWAPRSP